MKANEIHVRDPFVFVEDGRYILTGTTDSNCWNGDSESFLAYVSDDLENWTLAGPLFQKNPDF